MSYSENKNLSLSSESRSSLVIRKYKKTYSFEYGKFNNKVQFFLYTLAYTISIDCFGAIYKVGENTQSSILLLVIAYVLIGIPLYYMQMVLGQYCQMSMISLKYLIPLAHGLIYTMLLVLYLYTIRYSILLGDYCLYFMIAWQKHLPWMLCQNKTSSNVWGKCFSGLDDNKTCSESCLTNGTQMSSFLYYVGTYLNIEPRDITYFSVDMPNVSRSIALITSWATIYLFTALIYPRRPRILFTLVAVFYALLIMLNMGTMSTTGGYIGIIHMFHTDWRNLKSVKTLFEDVPNVVKQLKLSHAFIILNASRLKSKSANNIGTITVAFCVITFLTNMLCSLFLQSCLGMIVRRSNASLESVENVHVQYTCERLFASIPQCLGYLTVPQIWSLLYFMCTISIILANEITHINTIQCIIADVWPTVTRYHSYTTLGICVANCLVGMSFMGETNFQVSGQFADMMATLLEMINISFMSIVVFWIYGIRRLSDDICFMYGTQPTKFWKITWYLMPFIACFSMYFECSYYLGKLLVGKHNFIVRISLVGFASPIAILIFVEIFKHMKTRNLTGLFRPTPMWGPPDVEERRKRFLFNPRTDTTYRSKVPNCQHNCLLQSKVLKNLLEPESRCTDTYLHQMSQKRILEY